MRTVLQECPAVTALQWMALAKECHPMEVDLRLVDALVDERRTADRQLVPIKAMGEYRRIWSTRYASEEVVIDWGAVRRLRLPRHNPLREVARWWPADVPIPRRYLDLGFGGATVPQWRHTIERVWRHARDAGWLLESRRTERIVWIVGPAVSGSPKPSRTGTPTPVRMHGPSLAHHCLAVEATLCCAYASYPTRHVTALRGDSAIARARSACLPDSTAARPDIEYCANGVTHSVEVISRHYTAQDIREKRGLAAGGTRLVGTSRRTATRVIEVLRAAGVATEAVAEVMYV
jgi:hypothetical protein